MQETLDNLASWASAWQLNISEEKCSVFSVGNIKNIDSADYYLCGSKLDQSNTIKDIGVTITEDFKFSTHCAKIAAKAAARSYLLLKCFSTNNPYLLLRAFQTFVRPILENDSPSWSPYLLKDINCIEKVQRRFTRQLCKRAKINYTSYEHRLQLLSLQSLEERRIKADLCMLYKILNNVVELPSDSLFKRKTLHYATRGHDIQLKTRYISKTTLSQNSFFNRVIPWWNSLSNSVVSSPSFLLFKSRLRCISVNSFCKHLK